MTVVIYVKKNIYIIYSTLSLYVTCSVWMPLSVVSTTLSIVGQPNSDILTGISGKPAGVLECNSPRGFLCCFIDCIYIYRKLLRERQIATQHLRFLIFSSLSTWEWHFQNQNSP